VIIGFKGFFNPYQGEKQIRLKLKTRIKPLKLPL
jgi:hypothetical protein